MQPPCAFSTINVALAVRRARYEMAEAHNRHNEFMNKNARLSVSVQSTRLSYDKVFYDLKPPLSLRARAVASKTKSSAMCCGCWPGQYEPGELDNRVLFLRHRESLYIQIKWERYSLSMRNMSKNIRCLLLIWSIPFENSSFIRSLFRRLLISVFDSAWSFFVVLPTTCHFTDSRPILCFPKPR